MVTERCRLLADAEPLAGTAPHRSAWLVIEESGAWPRDALMDSAIVEFPQIAEVARQANVGVLLTRKDRVTRPERRVYLANRDELRTGHLQHLSQILTWDWDRFASGELPRFGSPHASLTLVCVHGTRDQCCAIDGRALIRAFTDDPAVVESSHIGGHRFAPVVLHLPSGYLYGRVNAHDVTRINAGEVVPESLRGCTYDPAPVQVVEQWIRSQPNFSPYSVFTLEYCTITDDRAVVSMHVDSRKHTVHLQRIPSLARPESCGVAPSVAESWTVIG